MNALKDISIVTATAPINIAVIKYWGKRDEELILPLNGSISATLDQEHLQAKTTVASSSHFTEDRLWLNGIEQSTKTDRVQNVLQEIHRRARKRKSTDDKQFSIQNWKKVHICSQNNFPTAAGLVSSAAGLACLVSALSKLYGIDGDVSDIARLGSGSACRSMYGGFVEWTVGTRPDGSDSVARQISPESHWQDMAILILVVNAEKKHTSSSSGMQTSVKTSQLLQHRAANLVPAAIEEMKKAIEMKDFEIFADLTMKDSNQMHAVCLDTYPPIIYLTDVSRDIIRMVHEINNQFDTKKVAYTFDAGPNACLYLLESDVPMVLGFVQHFFPSTKNDQDFVTGKQCEITVPSQESLSKFRIEKRPNSINYIISTKVGPGPKIKQLEEGLLDVTTGLPLTIAEQLEKSLPNVTSGLPLTVTT